MNGIEIENLILSYREQKVEKKVIGPLNLKIKQGERIVLIGPSGCGKSTLLMLLAGIKKPTEGGIHGLNKEMVVSYMPQNYGLLPWKNVYQNCMLPYQIKGIKVTSKEKQLMDELLSALEIKELKKRYPMRLSGGQKQRVALARAFAIKPQLLLMDEPFSALDAYMKEAAAGQFLEIWKKENCTTILVTHSIEEALYLGDRLVILGKENGQIQEVIANPFVEQFYKDLNETDTKRYKAIEQRVKAYLQGGLEA